MNKEKYSSWKDQIRLHLSNIVDNITQLLENEYTTLVGTLIVEQMNEKRNHHSMMIEISSSLNDVKFDDIKNCANAKKIWDKLIFL